MEIPTAPFLNAGPLYNCGAIGEAAKLLAKADVTNRSRDEVDGHDQFPLDMQLRTAIAAIVSGLSGRKSMRPSDWDSIAEGCNMVQRVEAILRPCCEKMR